MDVSWELTDFNIMKRLDAIRHSGAPFMIGITADPEERVGVLEEGGEDYDEMKVMYQTRSKSEVRRLLRELSDIHDGYSDGYNNQGPPFYLYALQYTE